MITPATAKLEQNLDSLLAFEDAGKCQEGAALSKLVKDLGGYDAADDEIYATSVDLTEKDGVSRLVCSFG